MSKPQQDTPQTAQDIAAKLVVQISDAFFNSDGPKVAKKVIGNDIGPEEFKREVARQLLLDVAQLMKDAKGASSETKAVVKTLVEDFYPAGTSVQQTFVDMLADPELPYGVAADVGQRRRSQSMTALLAMSSANPLLQSKAIETRAALLDMLATSNIENHKEAGRDAEAQQTATNFEFLWQALSDDRRTLAKNKSAMPSRAVLAKRFAGEAPVGGIAAALETNAGLAKEFGDLERMVGLDEAKGFVQSFINKAVLNKELQRRGLPAPVINYNMAFLGNPGTGKTEVAERIGKMMKHIGLLDKGHIVKITPSDVIAKYVGHTGSQARAKYQEALGGVLFIDEAYGLRPLKGSGNDFSTDFGGAAVIELLKFAEENRGKVMIIVAGYPAEMMSFIGSDPGLASRFKNFVNFVDYNGEELSKIFDEQLRRAGGIIEPEARAEVTALFKSLDGKLPTNAGNGRFVRNVLEWFMEARDNRVTPNAGILAEADLLTITAADVAVAKARAMKVLGEGKNGGLYSDTNFGYAAKPEAANGAVDAFVERMRRTVQKVVPGKTANLG